MRPSRFLSRWALLPLLALLLGAKATDAAFTVAWTAPLSDDNRGIAWADLNNDCYPDIIAVNNEPGTCIRIFRNNGNGTFTLMYTSTQADRCTAVAVADYDGDGLMDFAVANYSNIPSRIYHNDGNFNFHVAWSEPYAEYSTGIDWGDYDNDGKPDLIINSLTAGGVRFFHNDGAGNFSDAGLATAPGNAAATKFGDYDKDGFLDVFEGVTGYGSVIWKGNGTAGPVSVYTLPWNNNSDVDWKDFDGDGFLDIIEGSYLDIFRNAGGNTFPNYWNTGLSNTTQYVKGADYDGDGLTDFAMSNWAPSNFFIVHNNGGGVFVTIAGPSATDGPVAWADYNGDGRPDVVGGCFQSPGRPIVVYQNNGPALTPGPCYLLLTTSPTPTPPVTSTPTQTPTQTPTPTATLIPALTATPTPTAAMTSTPLPVQTATASCDFHVWPNPFNPAHAFDNTIKFDCLPTGAVVSLYTISGEWVDDIAESGGLAQWKGITPQGLSVAPGVYFYVAKNGNTVLEKGKFLLVH